jgi:molecular chaperone HscB
MDPFATLGLPRRYELDRAVLETRYRELQRALHPDKFAGAGATERRLSLSKAVEVNEAYRILRDDLARAEALLAQHRGGVSVKAPDADPAFLMEMMEQREALGEAKQKRDLEAVRELSRRIAAARDETAGELTAAFAALPAQPDERALQPVAVCIGRLKYFQRFLDEVSAIQEGAL